MSLDADAESAKARTCAPIGYFSKLKLATNGTEPRLEHRALLLVTHVADSVESRSRLHLLRALPDPLEWRFFRNTECCPHWIECLRRVRIVEQDEKGHGIQDERPALPASANAKRLAAPPSQLYRPRFEYRRGRSSRFCRL